MSSARQWFAKRVQSGPKASKDLPCPVPEKMSLRAGDGKSTGSFKFNTLAAVMGRKSKKLHRPITMQENVPVPRPGHRNPSRHPNRPPSNSVSSTVLSGDDPIEPRTPSDDPKDRHSFPISVLTMSDSDPFRPNGIPVPNGVGDPGAISLRPSVADVLPKELEPALPSRPTSFAPTLTYSRRPSDPQSPISPKSPSSLEGRNISARTLPESQGSGNPFPSEECSFGRAQNAVQRPVLASCGSSVTLTDKNPSETLSHSRPRGCTESTSHGTPGLPQMQRNESSSEGEPSSISVHRRPSTHRKISALRLATEPPCAPPPHALPAVPVPCESDVDDDSQTSPSGSGSPSSISFASSASPVPDSYSNEYLDPPYLTLRGRPVITDNESVASRKPTPGDISHSPLAEIFAHVRVSASTCPPSLPEGHSLKKSVSHSTLQRCMVGTWLPSSSSSGDPNSVEKEPRKQRSFHRSRHQTPPAVPLLRHTNSCTPSPSNPLPESPNARRGAPSSPPITVRKRLFSGSSQRRPSTGATEDDLRSVFSLPTEVERNQGSISLHTASLNEDSESEPLPNTSPTSPIEYAQQILSPAEMFAVEAKVQSEFENKYGGMIRNQQPTSPSALTPPLGSSYIKEGFNTAPSAFPRFGTHGFPPTSQNLPVPQSYVRPSTARDSSSLLSLQSGPSVGGLPLPPSRSRIRPHTAEPPYNRLPNINSLEGARMSHVPFVPLSPPPRRTSIRTVVSVESTQKSMIRKPSFLDITDETPSMEDSFLDLGNGKASLDILQVDEYDDDDDLVIYAQ